MTHSYNYEFSNTLKLYNSVQAEDITTQIRFKNGFLYGQTPKWNTGIIKYF